MIDRIVLNIPHSSDRFPDEKKNWEGEIEAQISRWTDWHTDVLFSNDKDNRIIPIIFPWSRFFCDAERLENDSLESIGQGIAYTDFAGCHRALSLEEKEEIFNDYYLVHQRHLKEALTPTSFLVDCHSFPEDLSPVDVCIGINSDWSTPDERIILGTKEIFSARGFFTEINEPYSNSISPVMPYTYPSMMIELNKRTYLSSDYSLDREKSRRIIEAIDNVYRLILGLFPEY